MRSCVTDVSLTVSIQSL